MPKVKYKVYEYVCRTDSFFPEKLQETANKLEELITQILGSTRYKPLIEVFVTSVSQNKTRYLVKIQESFLIRCSRHKSMLPTLISSRSLKKSIELEMRNHEYEIEWGIPTHTLNGVLMPVLQRKGTFKITSYYAPIRDYWIYSLVVKGELPPLN